MEIRMVHIPGWLIFMTLFVLTAVLLWQATTHAEFLWFLAGNVTGGVGIMTWAFWMQKRHAAKKAE